MGVRVRSVGRGPWVRVGGVARARGLGSGGIVRGSEVKVRGFGRRRGLGSGTSGEGRG